MKLVDIGVVTGALALSIAVVLLARTRSSSTAVDFQLAGRQMGVVTNACAICGDYVSAASFLGVAAAVYSAGLDGAWYATGFAAGFIPVLLFVATPLRRFGDRSLPDFLARRFRSERVRLVAVVVVELIILAYLVPQAVAGGLAWQLLSDVALPGVSPYGTGIIASTVLTALLVVIGGMRGTTWNQALQFVLLLAILVWLTLALVTSGFSYAGAVETASTGDLTVVVADDGAEHLEVVASRLDDASARFAEPGARYGAIGHFALVVTLIAGTTGLPHVMNRFFTSPSGRAARMTTVWVLGLVGLFYTLAVMLGTAARATIPDRVGTGDGWLATLTVDGVLRVPEHALLALGRLHGGSLGLTVVSTGALLAIMSTIGGLLLAASASWGHDIYERWVNPRATRVEALRAGQAAVVVVAVGAAVVAGILDPAVGSGSSPSVIAGLVTAAFALAGCTLTPCLVLGIWWKRTTAAAAVVGMVLGTVLSIGCLLLGRSDQGFAQVLQAPTALIGPLISLIMIGVSLVTRPVADVDDIWLRLHGSAQDRAAERIARVTLEARVR